MNPLRRRGSLDFRAVHALNVKPDGVTCTYTAPCPCHGVACEWHETRHPADDPAMPDPIPPTYVIDCKEGI